jgi:hypothetical protein
MKTYLNIILLSQPVSSKWSPSIRFPTNTPFAPLLSLIRATCPVHIILLDLMTRIIFREDYRSLISSLRSFLHSPVISSHFGPNIILSNLFPNYPQPKFFPQCEPPSFTPIQRIRPNYSSVYLNRYIFV